MYAFHKQIHPPTGIEHCAYCNFFSANEKSLLVAQASELTVYKLLKNVETTAKAPEKNIDGSIIKPKREKLEHLMTFSLYGNVMSLQTAALSGNGRDALLISFKDAKLSVVEYDPSTHDLKTLSMHYFEEEDLKDGLYRNIHIPYVRVDPENRCAVMLVYGSKLVVLPFSRGDTLVEETEQVTKKSAVLPSYVINLSELEEHVLNVVDIQFLHGYYEPTLLLLYEPLRTWPGRIAMRHDTCAMVALSLNLGQKVHPVIWALNGLPYDCVHVCAVPKPIGGVLLLAVNSLLYLNQSIPPYGVSLNSITERSTAFPLRPQDGVCISLDCAQATFISYDKLVLSLKGGEIYVLTLLIDCMRSVRGFHFDKAAASVLTCCICSLDEGYLFLGSRLGNSLLLKYAEKATDGITTDIVKKEKDDEKKEDEPPVKKIRSDDASDWMASDVALVEDPEELEVYGKETVQSTSSNVMTFAFEVCDSLINIGPCGNMTMGEPAFLSDEFQNSLDPDLELVTCSGYGKNGALSVLQRTIRPQVVTTFELPGCLDMWTVIRNKSVITIKKEKMEEGETEEPPAEKDESQTPTATTIGDKSELTNSHAFLILSREDSSMVLQTGQEITELDHSGFSTQSPTVFAGNVGENKYIVQVSPSSVRLMEGVNQLQHIPLDLGSDIVLCSLSDPYLLVMTERGDLMLLTLKADQYGSGHRLSLTKPHLTQKNPILSLCTYKDTSGIFTTAGSRTDTVEQATSVRRPRTQSTSQTEATSMDTSSADDEDELLYGSSEPQAQVTSSPVVKTEPSTEPEPVQDVVEVQQLTTEVDNSQPTYWSVICRDNGLMEIYSLPDFNLMFLVRNFPMAQKVLVDSVQSTATTDQGQQHDMLPTVKEIKLFGLGHKNSRPFLMALVDEDLLIYEAFCYQSASDVSHLKLRFKKISHDILIKEKKKGKKQAKTTPAVPETSRYVSKLRYFEDISSYSGVFVCGPYPHWIFVKSRGALRAHPMPIDGSVSCFAAFHNVNCPHGFLYFNRQGDLRISVLPTHLSYDAPWPVRKVPLRCTPHFVTYHVDSKTYAVVTSSLEPLMKIWRLGFDDQEFEEAERDERFVASQKDRFSIQLFSPLSWDAIPNTRIEFDELEHITCLKMVNLNSEGSVTGKKGFIAAAATRVFSEDVQCTGKVFIYDVIEVVPEPGQPLTKNKIKVLYEKEQKGPVSCICDCMGYLLTCVGQKVYLWTFKDNDLLGLAFIDTQIYIHNAISVKNFILVADVTKSIFLLQYQESDRTIALVSRDSKPLQVYSCEFMVDDSQLAFLASDVDKNLILYHYHPGARESCGGTRLLRRADINIGSHVNTFVRVRCKLSDPASSKPISGPAERRHTVIYASLDGSLGLLLPMTEKVYRRLLMLQNALTTSVMHMGGLNPRSHRHIVSHQRMLSNPHRNILDGDLLYRYTYLSVVEKNELAKKIGTTVDQIMDDLMDVERLTTHF
ncbi:cleavage and polyadenylation specificity factor subunit 1-like isoform X1 [Asterias amurensis]|uniref:cleavage and polyadenylation specificity factor subunit 1-like isoform X1 n=1 Tax=Asterias amurensis TaxID=7602 RepID=UPI003AB4139C